MKHIIKALPLAALTPALALAAGSFSGVRSLLRGFSDLINDTLIPLVFALAFVVFLWGMFKYFILGGGEEDEREKGKKLMLWGVIGFVVMVSLWAIVKLLASSLFDGGYDSRWGGWI